jgi:hypothetical protein
MTNHLTAQCLTIAKHFVFHSEFVGQGEFFRLQMQWVWLKTVLSLGLFHFSHSLWLAASQDAASFRAYGMSKA